MQHLPPSMNTSWRSNGPRARATCWVSHLADVFASRLNELIEMICLEKWKTIRLKQRTRLRTRSAPVALPQPEASQRRSSDALLDPPPEQAVDVHSSTGRRRRNKQIPWNSPGCLTIRALAPAMASGCARRCQASGQAAQTAALLASFCADVPEIPSGIVNFFAESPG